MLPVRSAPMSRDNLVQFFREYFTGGSDYLLYDNGYRWWAYSYLETSHAARVFADRLKEAGVAKGDRILLWSEARPEWVFAFWGAMLAGAVVVPLGAESSPDLVRRVWEIVQPKVIALGDDVSWDREQSGPPVWHLTSEDWAQPTPRVTSPAICAGDLAQIVFTSGATGEPKGVELTHGNLLSQAEAVEPVLWPYRKYAGPFFSPGFLQLLPLSHMFGQVTTLALAPLLSASVMMTRRQSLSALVDVIRRRGISAAVCVPRILDALRSHVTALAPEAAGAAVDRAPLIERLWRYRRVRRIFGARFFGFLAGGAPLETELEQFWAGLGYLIVQGYGLTETSPVVTLNNPLRSRIGSVGKPLRGVEVRIAGDGEILVRGPNVMPGYYRDPGTTAEVIQRGWFRTGDLGRVDSDGHVFIRGRKKEVIVTPEGLNIFPEDVERVLDRLPGVRESAVIGLPAERGGAGEQVHAVAVLEPGADTAEIYREANRRLEAHQRIRELSVWPDAALPRTPQTDKLRRGEIRDRIAARSTARAGFQPAGAAQECTPELAGEEIERRTGRKVSSGTSLDELGLGSIDRVELLLEFERRCRREIEEAAFASCATVGEVQQLMERVLAGQEKAGGTARSEFPGWNKGWLSRAVREANLALWVLPITRMLAKPVISGVEVLDGLAPPVIFAANHQSHLDTPLILSALPRRWRYRIAPAMYKEYFDAHFNARGYTAAKRAAAGLQYYLVALMFNAFPIPQQEAGVLDALRYAGGLVSEGWSLLIFPEGERRPSLEMGEFQPGVAVLATRLRVPVVPIHLEGVDRVLPRECIIPRFGRTRVSFGEPLRLRGEDTRLLAHEVRETVQAL